MEFRPRIFLGHRQWDLCWASTLDSVGLNGGKGTSAWLLWECFLAGSVLVGTWGYQIADRICVDSSMLGPERLIVFVNCSKCREESRTAVLAVMPQLGNPQQVIGENNTPK